MSHSKSNGISNYYLRVGLSLTSDLMHAQPPTKAQTSFAENMATLFFGKEPRKAVLNDKGLKLVDTLFDKIDQKKLKDKKVVEALSPEAFADHVYQTHFGLDGNMMDEHISGEMQNFLSMYADEYDFEQERHLIHHAHKGQLLIDAVQEALNKKIVETIEKYGEPKPTAYDGYERHIQAKYGVL